MYEFRHGTARLINAVWTAAQDETDLRKLAAVLHYVPEQLQEDAEAANDYYNRFREQAIEKEN